MPIFGCKVSTKDARDYKFIPCGEKVEFPKSFMLMMNTPRDQYNISSCTANSVAATAEYYNLLQNKDKSPMSDGFIYGYRWDGYTGEGLSIRTGLETYRVVGIPKHDEFPHRMEVPDIIEKLNEELAGEEGDVLESCAWGNRCSSYFNISINNQLNYNIKKALLDHGPVLICVRWHDYYLKDNVIHFDLNSDYGYHCVTIYGWNESGWLIQNSWGQFWGKNGRACIPYDSPTILEAWGTTDTIVDETDDIVVPVRDWKFYIKQFFYKIYNFFRKLFTGN